MKSPIVIKIIAPGDARGWIALGCYSLVVMVFAMIAFDRELLRVDAFLILATAIVITGWNGGPVGWAYQATKSGGELADRNADLVQASAVAAQSPPPVDPNAPPLAVKIDQTDGDPVPVTETKP